jgi:hypothetical protein
MIGEAWVRLTQASPNIQQYIVLRNIFSIWSGMEYTSTEC